MEGSLHESSKFSSWIKSDLGTICMQDTGQVTQMGRGGVEELSVGPHGGGKVPQENQQPTGLAGWSFWWTNLYQSRTLMAK